MVYVNVTVVTGLTTARILTTLIVRRFVDAKVAIPCSSVLSPPCLKLRSATLQKTASGLGSEGCLTNFSTVAFSGFVPI